MEKDIETNRPSGEQSTEKKESPEEKRSEEKRSAAEKGPEENQSSAEKEPEENTSSEEEGTEENKIPIEEIKGRFDPILTQHMERLLGTNSGIEGLSMNLASIPSIILIAERETEIESFPYLPPARYTNDTLFIELAANSLDPGEKINMALQEMILKGYLEVSDDGRLFAQKPTLSMAGLFDLVLPNMPGINLIAYLGQMMDEVHAKRKTLETASDQFDQMLKMQGIPLDQVKTRMASEKVSKPSKKRKSSSYQKDSSWEMGQIISDAADDKPVDIFSQLKTETWTATPRTSQTPSKDISSQMDSSQLEKEETEPGDPVLKEAEPFEPPVELHEDVVDQKPEVVEETKDEEPAEEIKPAIKEEAQQPETTRVEPDTDSGKEAIEGSDDALITSEDDIEKRIATFEETLGMACPLCRSGEIRSETTAKEKLFYRCSKNNCTFISWGKPFHLTCPQCNNPFLTESHDGSGKTILKCPRATCHYWQKLPWEMPEEPLEKAISASREPAEPDAVSKKPRRRVVRRRVVRRKR